jgi:hypothetical protein
MGRKSKVIIRGKIDDSLAIKSAHRRLLVIKNAQFEVRPFGLELVELIGQK